MPDTGRRRPTPKVPDHPRPVPFPTLTDGWCDDAGQHAVDPPPDTGLAPAYEQLRDAALSGRAGSVRHGLAAFARGGVVAWIRAAAELASSPPPGPTRLDRPAAPAVGQAPGPLATASRELVHILAALTLAPT